MSSRSLNSFTCGTRLYSLQPLCLSLHTKLSKVSRGSCIGTANFKTVYTSEMAMSTCAPHWVSYATESTLCSPSISSLEFTSLFLWSHAWSGCASHSFSRYQIWKWWSNPLTTLRTSCGRFCCVALPTHCAQLSTSVSTDAVAENQSKLVASWNTLTTLTRGCNRLMLKHSSTLKDLTSWLLTLRSAATMMSHWNRMILSFW